MISVSFSPSDINNTAEVALFEKGNFASGWAYKMRLAKSTFTFRFPVDDENVGANIARFTLRATTQETDTTYRTYSLKVNGTAHIISFVPGTLGAFDKVVFGGAAWAQYEAKIPLLKGINEIILTTHQEWGGFDRLEIWAVNEPKLYTEEQLKSPEMASFLSKMLGLYDKEDLEKAKQEATIAARVNYIPVSEVQTKISEATKGLFTEAQLNQKVQEVTEAIPLLVEQAVNSKTPIIQAEARKGWLPETEVEERVNAYKTVLKNEVIEVIEQS